MSINRMVLYALRTPPFASASGHARVNGTRLRGFHPSGFDRSLGFASVGAPRSAADHDDANAPAF